jgi:hypothetical protein
VVFAAMTGVTGSALALPCMSKEEALAEQARGLQSALMVAALKCVHKSSLGLHESYNAFVTRFNPELSAHSDVMQAYFRRSYGTGHKHQLNKYMTSMANHFSLDTFNNKNFCEDMAEVVGAVLAAPDGAVLRGQFATYFLPPTSAPVCKDPNDMASKDVPALSGTIPDLASIHMPDIESRPKQSADAAYATRPRSGAD